MNISINSYNLDVIPKEVLPTIFGFLPLYDKLRVIPLVSSLWHSIIEEGWKSFYREFAKNNLKNEIENYKFLDAHIDLIIEMVRKNHFISIIEKRASGFSYNRTDFLDFSSPIKVENQPSERSISYFNSDSFELYCNLEEPTNISNTHDKHSNFRTSIIIEIALDMLLYKKNILINYFRATSVIFKASEEKGMFFWNKIDSKKIKPLQAKDLIKHAIYLQLRLYIAYFTHLNMIALASVSCQDFKGNYPHLSFRCNKLGQIKSSISSKESFILLIIEKIKIEENSSVFSWKSSDDQTDRKKNYMAEDLLRWCIFSETLQQLSEKLGCSKIF